jgi:hypothetical protein
MEEMMEIFHPKGTADQLRTFPEEQQMRTARHDFPSQGAPSG